MRATSIAPAALPYDPLCSRAAESDSMLTRNAGLQPYRCSLKKPLIVRRGRHCFPRDLRKARALLRFGDRTKVQMARGPWREPQTFMVLYRQKWPNRFAETPPFIFAGHSELRHPQKHVLSQLAKMAEAQNRLCRVQNSDRPAIALIAIGYASFRATSSVSRTHPFQTKL